MLRSLRSKLTTTYALITLFAFGLVAFMAARDAQAIFLNEFKASLVRESRLVEQMIGKSAFRTADAGTLDGLVKNAGLRTGLRITLIDRRGSVIAETGKPLPALAALENHRERPEVAQALSGRVGTAIRYSTTVKEHMLYAAVPVEGERDVEGVVRTALPLSGVSKLLGTMRRTIVAGIVFAAVLALGAAIFYTRRITRPIQRIIDVSRRFAAGDFSRRILAEGPRDELRELAGVLNTMAQEIEEKIQQVTRQNQQLEAVFNSMIEGVIVVDRQGRLVSVNPTIEGMFGVSQRDVEGRLVIEAVRNNDIADAVSQVLRDGGRSSGEFSLLWPAARVFRINAVPVFDKERVSGCLVVIHEITEIRRLETMRRDFVANVSHELKTPLTAIKGFVETLLDGALDDKENSRHFLEIVKQHADRLEMLINELLTLSYLESAKAQLELQTFDIRTLADKVLNGYAEGARRGVRQITNNLPSGLQVRADSGKIQQVLTNLIDNAVKFNKLDGTVAVTAEVTDAAVRVIVEDSGIGIPAKDIPRIFERFYRVDKARSRELGGTGLGLSIVKHIIELHGGSVGVESIEGVGSKFWFIVPK